MNSEYKYLAKLGLPIVVGQLGVMIQGVIDTIMLGNYNTQSLAAAGFVNSIFTLVSVMVMGFTFGIIPQCGAAYGRNDIPTCGKVLKAGLISSLFVSLIGTAVMIALFADISLFGQPQELEPLISCYFWWTVPSMIFVGVSSAFKSFFDSITQTKVAMWAILIGNAWNIVWNLLLIYGMCGFPEMGVEGAAIATLTSRLIILLIYVFGLTVKKSFDKYLQAFLRSRICRKDITQLFRMGLPTSIQSGMEISSFSICAIFAGWLGTDSQAAHQIMANISACIWVVYNGVGIAVGVRVSNFVGMDNYPGIRHTVLCGLKMILCCAVMLNILFISFHDTIITWFTSDTHIMELFATMVLPLVLYQFGDALQTNYVNALRGLGRVRYLIQDAFIAYMIVSLPVSYILGIACGFGVAGLWMGFPFGLSTAAILYIKRFRRYSNNA